MVSLKCVFCFLLCVFLVKVPLHNKSCGNKQDPDSAVFSALSVVAHIFLWPGSFMIGILCEWTRPCRKLYTNVSKIEKTQTQLNWPILWGLMVKSWFWGSWLNRCEQLWVQNYRSCQWAPPTKGTINWLYSVPFLPAPHFYLAEQDSQIAVLGLSGD